MRLSKKKTRSTPAISTAALPDIIFMLLFFFMVVTVMRDQEALLVPDLPASAYAQKMSERGDKLAISISIKDGAEVVQIAHKVVPAPTAVAVLSNQLNTLSDIEREELEVDLKIDKAVKMKIVSDIKMELRRQQVYDINYLVTKST